MKSQLKKKWKKLRPKALQKWRKLSWIEVKGIKGRRDRLARLLCEKYELNQEQAQREINDFFRENQLAMR